jgi:phenylacetate-CoA ligase
VKDPNDFSPPYWVYAAGGERVVFSSPHLNAATLDAFVQELRSFGPNLLYSYPTSLEALCVLLQDRDLNVQIPNVVCSSEMLHARVWRAAQDRLGCSLLDYYGQAERVALAYATAPGEYRFVPGYAHVEFEIVASEGSHNVYEIIGTPLWNAAMPLVRYRTGDLVRLPATWGSAEKQAAAIGALSFDGVIGRDSDILLSPDGARLTGISHFQRDVEHLVRIQVIQETLSKICISVLGQPQFSEVDRDKLMENVRSRVPQSMDVQIEQVDALERTALGKTPFVIHRPEVRRALQSGQARASYP